jgi:hypothetical protein
VACAMLIVVDDTTVAIEMSSQITLSSDHVTVDWSSNETNMTTVVCSNDYCISDDDYIAMIRDYVFPTAFEWTLTALYVIVFLLGVTGNALVCYVVWRNAHMRTITNLFIVNLSAADLLVLVVCLPPSALVDITETWYFGVTMCKLVHYLQGVSVSVSVLTLTFISVERYYAICHPLRFQSTLTRTRVVIGIIWTISLALLLPEMFVLDVHRRWPAEFTTLLASCRPSWSNDRQTIYQFVLFSVLYVLPLAVMAFAYIQIARRLWNSLDVTTYRQDCGSVKSTSEMSLRHSVIRVPRCNSSDVRTRVRSRRTVAKMLAVVVVIFAVCYLPVHVLNICRYARVGWTDMVATRLALIAHWLCYFNSAINPVIYNLMSARFMKSFKRACWSILHMRGCHHKCVCCKRRRSALLSCRTTTYAVSSSHSEPLALKELQPGCDEDQQRHVVSVTNDDPRRCIR